MFPPKQVNCESSNYSANFFKYTIFEITFDIITVFIIFLIFFMIYGMYSSSVFSMFLNEDVVDIKKPDGICLLTFVVDEFSSLVLHPSTFFH